VRVVLDANVVVSALLSRAGALARLIQLWFGGEFDFVACELLIAEIERTLAAPKIRRRIPATEAHSFVALLRATAELVPDPDEPPPVRSADAGDDYLLALAARERVPIVSGDTHLLVLHERVPVLSSRGLVERLESS
jgi:putative PIN family toxin of toxin-antitoxin system